MTMRALVLGGGGPLGLAWQSGLIAGFARAGVDLGAADVLLGTSSGAVVGARLALGAPAATLVEALAAPAPSAARSAGGPDLSRLGDLVAEAQSGTRNPAEVRREMGALALAAQTGPDADFVAQVAALLGGPQVWPARDFACTAVEVETGGFQLLDRDAGVDLAAAVAASCSVPGLFPPVSLGARRYMDGGLRSFTNADLAASCDLVVVLAVLPPGAPAFLAQRLDEEVECLKAGGGTVVSVTPDEAASAAFGPDLFDLGRSRAVAAAGLAQGASQAAVLQSVWG